MELFTAHDVGLAFLCISLSAAIVTDLLSAVTLKRMLRVSTPEEISSALAFGSLTTVVALDAFRNSPKEERARQVGKFAAIQVFCVILGVGMVGQGFGYESVAFKTYTAYLVIAMIWSWVFKAVMLRQLDRICGPAHTQASA
jgi:CHASE2 domain-containing sensor protein